MQRCCRDRAGGRKQTLARLPVTLLAAFALPTIGCTTAQPVRSDQEACTITTARITELRHLPVTYVAYCDASKDPEVPGYYIVGLHAYCREELCGSTLMGWFAVRQTDGAVFDFVVGEERVGKPVSETQT